MTFKYSELLIPNHHLNGQGIGNVEYDFIKGAKITIFYNISPLYFVNMIEVGSVLEIDLYNLNNKKEMVTVFSNLSRFEGSD